MSKHLSVDLKDILKAFGVAVATAAIIAFDKVVSPILDGGALPSMEVIQKAAILSIAAAKAAAIAYIAKNFFTSEDGQFRLELKTPTATAQVEKKPGQPQPPTAGRVSVPTQGGTAK